MTFSSLVGERLKETRKSLGLNQAEIAEAVGVTREYWGRCERGASVPGGEVLAALAQEGADVLYILTGNHTPRVPAPDPMEQLLVTNYRECTAEDKAALIKDSTLYAAHVKKPTSKSDQSMTASVTNSFFGRAVNLRKK